MKQKYKPKVILIDGINSAHKKGFVRD